jgi:YD repeat-containing protein
VEHKRAANDNLLIGYEYSYDPLGRVVQSVERPSGDVTSYTYTPAGRLESEGREGQVRYSRYYAYNLDGSRAMVMRDDALNGSHWDEYAYDPVSGRLSSVTDTVPEPDVVHSFVWNPEGALARWEEPNSYARVFGYDEEGRLTKIEAVWTRGTAVPAVFPLSGLD